MRRAGRELLRRAPGLRVLAAGRRPLGVAGERACPAGAAEPSRRGRGCSRTAPPRSLPRLRRPTANRAAVAELCRRLDGIPLALELAAGRLRALSLDQLLHRLDDRFRLLTGGGRGALPRHQTLRTAIGWSHELCTPEERLLWARLSVFAGQFDLEAAEYVCAGPDCPPRNSSTSSAELLAQSVVVREETAGRACATGCWTPSGRTARTGWRRRATRVRLRRRHRDWYLGLATWCELDWFSPRQARGGRPDRGGAAQSAGAPWSSAWRAAPTPSGPVPGGHAVVLLGGLRPALGGTALAGPGAGAGTADHERGAAEGAVGARLCGGPPGRHGAARWGALHECREEAERTGNATAAAYAVHRTGCLALVSDDMPRAETLLRSALDRYREIGELNSNVLMGQVELAMALAFQGELADAVRLCEDVREVCEEHGERWTLAYALYVLAYAAWTRGDGGAGPALLEECLAIDHAFHDLLGSVLAIELLALVTLGEGDAAEAAVLQGAAGRIWPSVGLPLFGSAYYNAAARAVRGAGPGAAGRRALRGRAVRRGRPARPGRGGGRGVLAGPGRAVPAPAPLRCGITAPGHERTRRLPHRERWGDGGLRCCCA